MFTTTSLIAIVLFAFVCRKTLKYSFSRVPALLFKTTVTADTAITAGYNTVLAEIRENTKEQAIALGLDETASTDDVFVTLSGIDPNAIK